MTERRKQLLTIWMSGIFLAAMLIMQLLSHDKAISDSERRALQKMPEISLSAVTSGKFMGEFDTFTLDQFPFRDTFRAVKSFSALYVFGQKQVNDLYVKDGYVAKVEYPKMDSMLNHAAKRFEYIYNAFLKDTDVKIYSSIVPDKNYFLAPISGRLAIDYDGFIEEFREKTPYMQYCSILDLLTVEQYYRTDSHWRQETLVPVAKRLLEAMDSPALSAQDYEVKKYDRPFAGVYYGQLALPLAKDELFYLTNDMLEQCKVTSYDTGKPKESFLYDFAKAEGRDMYEMFLSGSDALLVVENPNPLTDKELILFRDSFSSSLAPLFTPSYKKITVVDIRYIQSQMLGNFIEFDNQDVLFLYSAIMLNNSLSFK